MPVNHADPVGWSEFGLHNFESTATARAGSGRDDRTYPFVGHFLLFGLVAACYF